MLFVVLSLIFGVLLTFKLAPADRRSENIRVHPIVIAELERGTIERKVFAAYLVHGVAPRATLTASTSAAGYVTGSEHCGPMQT